MSIENEIKDIKVVLAYLLRNEPWPEAEILYLKSAIKRLGIRVENKLNDDNLNRENV